jgi:hypothetical protein
MWKRTKDGSADMEGGGGTVADICIYRTVPPCSHKFHIYLGNQILSTKEINFMLFMSYQLIEDFE